MNEITCSACGHSIDEHEKNMGCLHKVAPLAMCSCCNSPEDIILQILKERDDRLRWWLETYDITMPCGHKNRYLAEGEDGTQYCSMCQLEEYKKFADVTACAYCGHESPKNDRMAIIDHVLTCDQRPEKKLLKKAFEIEDSLFTQLEHISQYGYRPDNCEVCEIVKGRLELWRSE